MGVPKYPFIFLFSQYPDGELDDPDGTDLPTAGAAFEDAQRIVRNLKKEGRYDHPGIVWSSKTTRRGSFFPFRFSSDRTSSVRGSITQLVTPAKRRIVGAVGNLSAGRVQIVAATKDGETVYWALAVPRERAVEAMQRLLAPGWSVALTGLGISPSRVAALDLRPNGIRELGPTL